MFTPRSKELPTLEFVELRLNNETCGIEMTVHDEAGSVVVLEYALASSPKEFDLDRLRRAWVSGAS